MPSAAHSARNALQGRINEHEIAFGDMSLPRQHLPKVGNALLDRYQAARQNVLVLGALGAIQQMAAAAAGSKPGTHRSGRGAVQGSNSQGRLTAAAALANAHAGTVAPVAAAARGSSGSRRGSRAASEYDDGDDDEQGSDGDGGPAGLHRLGLSSAWSSFKSSAKRGGGGGHHAASAQDGDPDALSREPSGGLDAEASYATTTRSRASRRYHRQASNNSMASRASASASACGSYASSSAVSSSGTARRLGRESSYVSSSSSGHTLRSHRAGSVAGGSTRRKGGKKKPPKPKPGRVTLAFAEFGAREDWVSQTLLKHALASIIQAWWRGYHTRQRWKADKQQLVEEEQARLCAAETQAARLQDMQHKLALYQQKKLAQAAEAAAADAAAEDGGSPEAAAAAAAAASHWSAPSIAVSRATSAARRRGEGYSSWQSRKSEASFHPGGGADGCCDSDSDSGWSDVELEDVAGIKFRAVTPPWQRVAEHQQMSQQLRQRTAAAAAAALGLPLDATADWGADPLGGMLSLWSSSSSENTAKLKELRRRRISRKPEPVPLSAPAAAAAAAAGLLTAGADAAGEGDAPASGDGADADAAESADEGGGAAGSSAPLSADVVEQLLLERYHSRFNRLGVPHKMPGRQRWRLLQQAQADDDAAAAPGLDAVPAAVVQGVADAHHQPAGVGAN